MPFKKTLTIYGRNAVYEALCDKTLDIAKLHLSSSNKKAQIIDDLVLLASKRAVEVKYHDKLALSRISKNSKQDQGVALDISMKSFADLKDFVSQQKFNIIAIDGVNNPQNLGMIIRSACAGYIDAILLSKKGTASLSPLVIKASAGAIFKMPLIQVNSLALALKELQNSQAKLYALSLKATKNYKEIDKNAKNVFILGNESGGVSQEIEALCDETIIIPMNRGVESLNVAVAASLLAFN